MGNSRPKIRAYMSASYCTMVLVDTLVSGVRDERHVECCGHSHQVCQRIDLHLPHHPASVGLDRDLADTELECDLFVQQAGDDQCHDLAFAWRERFVTVSKRMQFRFVSTCSAAALDRQPDRSQQDFIAERLG